MAGLISLLASLASPAGGLLTIALLLSVLCVIPLYVYRIYFSPISHIPGPRLAAATRWYEFYYNVLKVGRYYVEIKKMHRRYVFFVELYNVTKKLDKDAWFYSWLGRNESAFATTDPDLHKLRSAPIKKAFSMKSIARIETVLEKHLATLCRRLNGLKERKRPANMSVVFRSLAVDVVTDVSLPESMDLLEMEYLGAAHEDFLRGFTEISLWNRHLLYVNAVFERLRKRLVGMQGETALHLMDAVEGQKEQARRVIAN